MTSPLIHHVSVINRDSKASFEFYHTLLGLDFLLKTVNQDDLEMYHLFFGDTTGRPGTEFSVFEMKSGTQKKYGTNSLERTIFAVPSEESLLFWEKRLRQADVFNCEIEEYHNTKILRFEDADGVLLGLQPVAKEITEKYYPLISDEIPEDHAIFGIQAVHCRVRYSKASTQSFKEIFDLEVIDIFEDQHHTVTVLSKADALFGQQLHLVEDRLRNLEEMGSGAIQHIALNATNENQLLAIEKKILRKNFHYSGIKNREFFKSLYYREPNSLLIEVATEQTNFTKQSLTSTNFDELPLFLPPFLESRRSFIESKLI
ncbi:VOC family protein [Kurthia sibirica]|uniref:Ring-cleaving dioxygenase n=1 Tax=Kurthia sibirica TaxID=202750 RepID=A0A2U3AIS2_9BACL|nr:VOC family protein [Kurthia sibirica]PWI24407.1 ring-cleaving dioxygenase [Kurthia sibirica]GEK33824.1 glyoxalase [Kurthia sibirica]